MYPYKEKPFLSMLNRNTGIHLCYFTDANYWYPVLVSAYSAARHLSSEAIMVVHILYTGLDENILKKIRECMEVFRPNVRLDLLELNDGPYKHYVPYHDTWMIYLRLDVFKLLHELDWVLLVDGDTLWMKSPENVWNLRDNDYHAIGSHDMANPAYEKLNQWYSEHNFKPNWPFYFCAGFFLLNLKAYREEKLYLTAAKLISEHGMPPNLEQDIFNIVCKNKTLLPLEWGVFAKLGFIRDVSMKDIGCVHFVGDLPWKLTPLKNLASDIKERWWMETKLIQCPLPQKYKDIHNTLRWFALRFIFKLWKNCSFLWNIPFLFRRFGNEWPEA